MEVSNEKIPNGFMQNVLSKCAGMIAARAVTVSQFLEALGGFVVHSCIMLSVTASEYSKAFWLMTCHTETCMHTLPHTL